MAKLLHLNRPNTRVSKALRAWWVMRRQKRRRRQGQPELPPLPTVLVGNGSYYAQQEWFNTVFEVQVDLGGWPEAMVEIWLNVNEGGFAFLDLVASDIGEYLHVLAAYGEELLVYKARYRSATGELGPFSNELAIQIVI